MTDDIRYLKGVGPRKGELLNRLGIYCLDDLFYYFPLRYEDRTNFKLIKDLKEGEIVCVQTRIAARKLRRILYRKSIYEVALEDESGIVRAVWFNQPYLNDYLEVGDQVIVYGKVSLYKGKLQLNAPQYEKVDEDDSDTLHVGRIAPIYRSTQGLHQKFLRRIIYQSLSGAQKLNEPLPFHIRKEKDFPNIRQSLLHIHFPQTFEEAERARERFIFEELFISQVLVYLRKAKHRTQQGIAFSVSDEFIVKLKKRISFTLTASQEKVLGEIFSDMGKTYPMHRLLQGDVGCGKTVVALFSLAVCAESGYQAAFMAPTEVLARQHHVVLVDMFKGLGFKIDLLVGSLTQEEKAKVQSKLKKGKIDIVVGTHALLQKEVQFKKLGLAVIDEQHKFGVAQRALLPQKGDNPDCLVMSATPIPRSLALSLYGDLDLSVINELPPGRKYPQTLVVGEGKRRWLYNFLSEKLAEGRQVYFVYPVIEENLESDLRSAEEMYERLKKRFSEVGVGIFHSRIPQKEKEDVVKKFRSNKVHILVCTTVIEVGLNIENATVMVVEHPERFGLSQLHQLRGRIRRSTHKPHFVLVGGKSMSGEAKKRLEIISKVSDGFRISEEDLKLRGPGDFFGHFQHGFPSLKIVNPIEDLKMLKEARVVAYGIVKSDPQLAKAAHRSIREYIDSTYQVQLTHEDSQRGSA